MSQIYIFFPVLIRVSMISNMQVCCPVTCQKQIIMSASTSLTLIKVLFDGILHANSSLYVWML